MGYNKKFKVFKKSTTRFLLNRHIRAKKCRKSLKNIKKNTKRLSKKQQKISKIENQKNICLNEASQALVQYNNLDASLVQNNYFLGESVYPSMQLDLFNNAFFQNNLDVALLQNNQFFGHSLIPNGQVNFFEQKINMDLAIALLNNIRIIFLSRWRQ
uniref:Uncharacterized protein n=1 Tax=Meloidogyne enterolobii TaxID=390850 RepID=A0A6V7Y8Q6_MELEN|nr:unnamed protein product [Meloidogyne enterolobii]